MFIKQLPKSLDLYLFSIIYFSQISCFPFLKICSFQKISTGDVYVKKKEKKKEREKEEEEGGRRKEEKEEGGRRREKN